MPQIERTRFLERRLRKLQGFAPRRKRTGKAPRDQLDQATEGRPSRIASTCATRDLRSRYI